MRNFTLMLFIALMAASVMVFLPSTARAEPPVTRALILDDPSLPDYDAALGVLLRRTLTSAGYEVIPVTVDVLRKAETLAPPNRCALLVLPQARRLPAPLIPPVEAYVRRGGNLVVLGAPAWQKPTTVLLNGIWHSADEDAAGDALGSPATPFLIFDFRFPTGRLIRETNTESVPTRITLAPTGAGEAPGKEKGALRVTIPALSGWDMWRTPDLLSSPFEPGQTETVFSAWGGPRTRRLALEWDERDGSRWIAVISLTERWRKYTLSPTDFHGWGVSAEREREGFHPRNVVRFKAGLAFTHTGTLDGAHEYWLAGIGTEAASPTKGGGMPPAPPVLETIAPAYKFSSINGNTLRLATPPEASPLITPAHWESLDTASLMSSPPRATGAGFAKGRTWRWQPLLVARDAGTGQWRGVPATLFVNKPDGGAPNAGGVWVSLAAGGAKFYRQPEVQVLIGDVARRIRVGMFLLDGGADAYTVLPGQSVHLGATLANMSETEQAISARVTVSTGSKTAPVWQHTWKLSAVRHSSLVTPEAFWSPPAAGVFPPGGYVVTAELLDGTTVVDRVQHRLFLWTPAPTPQFVTVGGDGHFHLDEKLWRACGVNYTPSSGIAQETDDLYQRWLSPAAYDPESVERDLYHIEELGFNAVSTWVYPGEATWQNLLDFLRRCNAHHLKVSLMLAPDVGSPAVADALRPLIEKFRLPENDTLFAYEVAWEPEFNGHDARATMDGDWERWVTTRYGSIASAEQAWRFAIPRGSGGKVTNPSDDALEQSGGPQARLAIDYRRFLDDWLAQRYSPITRRLREIDNRHAVSFRMSYAGDPTARGRTPYQFEGLAHAVDFLAPEAYGRVGNAERVRQGWFTVAYARAVAPTKPVVWAEAGLSVWDPARDGGSVDPDLLTTQGRFYEDFFQMAQSSGSDGIFFWWYPGGYRFGEGSDYGLLNPDGTDRPAAAAIRRSAAAFKTAPPPPPPTVWLPFSRDAHADGIFGVYDTLANRFWEAVAQGQRPGLRSQPVKP